MTTNTPTHDLSAANRSSTLEERLQPWLDQAEYLIILTLIVMAWAAGWVDLLGFESDTNTDIFGRYSLPYFGILTLYTLGFAVWIRFMVSLRALHGFKNAIHWLQRRPIVVFPIWVIFGLILWTMLGGSLGRYNFGWIWADFRLFEIALLVLMVLFTTVILIARPVAGQRVQTWRKVAMGIFGIVIASELVLQGLALARVLPAQNLTGTTVSYGRIYQNAQGFGSGLTNSYGWYYPEFRMEDGSRRILLSGDTYIQALQIDTRNHMGVLLDARIAADESQPLTEVLAQGHLGFGPTHFMNWRFYPYLWEQFALDEIVIFFHLANDFQVNFDTPGDFPRVGIQEDGTTEVVPEDFDRWHLLADISVLGHGASDPMRTLVSQSLLLNTVASDVIARDLRLSLHHPIPTPHLASVSEAQPFGAASFVFANPPDADAERALTIAAAQIATLADYLSEREIALRLVTIPYFPAAFYTTNTGTDWTTAFAGYDLLAPEERLVEAAAAAGVPVLAMGDYLRTNGYSVDDIQSLFFESGTGYLTEAGHAVFAEALNVTFYNNAASN